MEAIASKRLLVVGPENGLAAATAREFDADSLPTTFVADASVDWQDKVAVDKLFDRHKPCFLLHEMDLQQSVLLDPKAKTQRDELQKRSRLLAQACAKYQCIAMHLSDYHVFGSDTKNAYDETDPPAPLDSYGELLAEIERQFVGVGEGHLILRFSWLIDADSDNLFTRILAALTRGDELHLSRYRRGSPTWQTDARRVICGVIRQTLSGAENWGYFHYCSADSCNEWEFGREVEATLSELTAPPGKIQVDEVKENSRYPREPASATLNSRRIRNNFGVHGRSWRQGLKGQISHWLERQVDMGSRDSEVDSGNMRPPSAIG